MSREASITQEQINAAADAIRAGGAKPTARAVREQIGSGSMATILKLLQVWQAGQIKPTEQAVTLPLALTRALIDFIGQEVATAKAGLEADLATAQQAQAALINESESQASTIELQMEALEVTKAEQAEQAGRMGQLGSDLAKARDDGEQERQAAEAARTELAKAQLRLENVPRIEADIKTLREQLAAEHQARVDAEQAAAVATAELKGSERRGVELEQRAASAEAQIMQIREAGETAIKELRQANEATTAEAKKTAQALASVQASAEAQGRELVSLREALAEARDTARALGLEANEARDALEAARSAAAEARIEAAQLRGRLAQIEALEAVAA